MPTRGATLSFLLAFAVLSGCGGGGAGRRGGPDEPTDEELRLTADDVATRPVIKKAELTTEVDEDRYKCLEPPKTEFEPAEHPIYFLAILKDVPTDSTIEVRWYKDSDTRPQVVRDVQGSDKYEFISSFSPAGSQFVPGTYTVRVFIRDEEVGAKGFTILGDDPFTGGVKIKDLKLSTKVRSGMRPKRPAKQFKTGTRKVYATFKVAGAPSGAAVSVTWTRNDSPFHEEDLDVPGDGRFGAQIQSKSRLPDGSYQVTVSWDDGGPLKSSFTVGEASRGPSIDAIALGHELGEGNMPDKEMDTFRRGDEAIMCGLRFLDLPPDSVITIEWTRVEEDGDSVYHITRTAVPGGGSGTMGAGWQPDGSFEPGDYKAVVIVGEETLTEAPFKIE
ncbi:MAG: hypothetical protein JRF63_02025 [Deltaproteobacteria bacterium]|nr:hypothetical protein [Deltaproteobacteria bacterium]